jgi:hypothetical protein
VITLWVFDYFLGAPSPAAVYLLAIMAGLVIAAALGIFELGDRRAAFTLSLFWFPVLFAALMNGPFPLIARRHSQRELAHEIASYQTLPQRLVMIGEETGSFMFYLSPSQRAWFRDGRVVEANGKTTDHLASLPPGWIVAITDKELDRTLHAQEVRRLSPGMAGSFRIVASPAPRVTDRQAFETLRHR